MSEELVPREILKLLDELGLRFETYENVSFEEITFKWAVVVLIRDSVDVEKYEVLLERIRELPEVVKGGFITFKVVS